MQSSADYTGRGLDVQDRRGRGRKILCRRLQTCTFARSVSVRGERRGTGVASGHKGVYGVCVWTVSGNANRYRRRMASPPDAPSLLELAVRFIHLVTHTRPDQQADSPKKDISEMRGVARRGVFSRERVGED